MARASEPLRPGQRVRHDEFGLGVVADVEYRQATVRFDSGGSGTFNAAAAPLTRALWGLEAAVLVRSQGVTGVVLARQRSGERLLYKVRLVGSGLVGTVEEADLADPPPSAEPDERLAQRQFDLPKLFYFRTIGHYLACARGRLGAGSIAARIEPKPHQIFVARRVLEAPRARFLLADEVGLGKTIEAGLILQELRARGALDRVLIVVPTNLTVQWLYELRQKFNERFRLYDAPRVKQELAEHPGENIWELGRHIICSQGLLAANPKLWRDILAVPWDMVVFDEAHHLRRQQQGATKLFAFAEQISKVTRDLLLLTATPMQLDPYELYSLVELLDPTLFFSYEYFEEQRGRNKALNAAMRDVLEIERLDEGERQMLSEHVRACLHFSDAALARGLVDEAGVSQRARDALLDRLAAGHLLSEVMIRNRKRAVGGFTRRIPRIIPVELNEAERRLYDGVIAFVRAAYGRLQERERAFLGFVLIAYQKRLTSSLHAFRISVERRLAKLAAGAAEPLRGAPIDYAEQDLDAIVDRYGARVALGDAGEARDAEVAALRALLAQAGEIRGDAKYRALESALEELFARSPDERVLIFTQFVDTIEYLEGQLGPRWPTATFHGRMRPKDKDGAIAAFRRGDARILLSSEAGGEGRNLQFCAILINYDLPWNPMKVEQRIGRLDRIGQTRDVQIYNFSLVGTVEERVLDVLGARIHAFEETVGGLDPILGQMELDVQRIIFETVPDRLDGALASYGDRLEAEVARAREADEVMRDLIVDRRSLGSLAAEQFDDAERERLARHANKLSKMLLKHIDADFRPLGHDTYRIELGKRLKVDLPQVPRESYQITFNYHEALLDDLLEYGSFGHPLFDALLEHCAGDVLGGGLSARRTIVDAAHAGFAGFQFNFLVTVRSLQELREVVPVAIDLEGREHPELRDLLIDAFDWQQTDAPFDPTRFPDWASMVERARDAAEAAIDGTMGRVVGELRARRQEDYQGERRKIEQYCAYRNTQAARKIAHAESIVARLASSEDDDDRRILPAWRSKLERDTADLEALRNERLRLERELESRLHVAASAELLSAAWVTIVPPDETASGSEEADEEIAK